LKTATKSRLLLLMLLLVASVVNAKEKLLILVQKTDLVSSSGALEVATSIGNLQTATERYEVIPKSELSEFYAKNFDKTESATPNDLVKLNSKIKADKILSVLLLGKNGENIIATARLIDPQDNSIIAFNKLNYEFGLEKFSDLGVKEFIEPVLTGKTVMIPEGSLSVTTNDQIKVYVDKKRVKDSYLGNLSLTEGFHEVFLQREDGYIVDKSNVYFSEKSRIEYDYNYKPKGEAVMKSFILPGWGQFSTDRNVSGSIYATAAVGSIALLGYGVMSYNQSKSDYDDAKINSETATLYKDRVAYADQANGFRDDCTSANTLVFAGAAALAVTYIVSALDIYFNGSEHELKIKGKDSFSGLKYNGNAFSYNFPVNTNSEKHNPNK